MIGAFHGGAARRAPLLALCLLIGCSDSEEGQDGSGLVQLADGRGPMQPQPQAGHGAADPSTIPPADTAADAPAAPSGGPPAPADPSNTTDTGMVDAGVAPPVAEACPVNADANPADADPCTAPLRPGEDRLCEFEYGGDNRWRGMSTVAMLTNTCSSIDRPQPYIGFHATGDALTSYADSRDLAEIMAGHNGCTQGPETVDYGGASSSPEEVCFAEPYGLGSPDAPDPHAIELSACPADRPVSSCQIWSGCDEDVEVRFCTVAADTRELGGHLLYRNDTSLALGPLSWQFFKRFWK